MARTKILQEGRSPSISDQDNFQSSGYPYASGSSVDGLRTISFGQITREITLVNDDGSNSLFLNEHGDFSRSSFELKSGESFTASWKVARLHLSSSATVPYRVAANLSHVPTSELQALTTGSFGEYRGSWIA